MRLVMLAFIGLAILAGCSMTRSQHSTNMDKKVAITPKPLPDRESFVFLYNYPEDANLREEIHALKEDWAKEYQIVGESEFSGDFENPFDAKSGIQYKGANLLIVGVKPVGARTITHSSNSGSSVDSGYLLTGIQSGVVSNSGRSSTWTEKVGQYKQYGLWLRANENDDNKKPWEQSYSDVADNLSKEPVEYWENDSTVLAIYDRLDSKGQCAIYYENKNNEDFDSYRLPNQKGTYIRRGDLLAYFDEEKWLAFMKMPVFGTIERDGDQIKVILRGADTFYVRMNNEDAAFKRPLKP